MAMNYILLVGAHWIHRQGVKQTLKRLGLTILGEGDSVTDACSDIPGATRPDIILAIAGQAGQFETALEAVHEAKKQFSDAKFAIWGEAASASDVSAAIRAGADALLSSTLSSRMLGNSLQLVLLGHKLFPTLPVQKSQEEQEGLNEPAPMTARLLLPSPILELQPDLADHLPLATSCVIKLEDHVFSVQPQGSPANLAWSNGQTGFRGAVRSVVPSSREWEILRCLSSGKSNKAIARELNIAETTVKVHIKSLLRKLSVSNRTQAAIWALNNGDSVGADTEPLLITALLHGK